MLAGDPMENGMDSLKAYAAVFRRIGPFAVVALVVAILVVALAAAGRIGAWDAVIITAILAAGTVWNALRIVESEPVVPIKPSAESSNVPLTVFDALPDPLILLDTDREVVAANLAARELFEPDMVGVDLALSLRHPTVLSCVDAVLAGEPVKRAQISLPVPVARNFEVHAVGLPSGGVTRTTRAVRVVLVLHDMTLAIRAEQMRADFVANVSHELRSPLSALIGFIETLRGPARDDEKAREHFLEIMHREAERMSRLIGDLLSLTRVEVNEHVQPREPIDLARLIAETVELLVNRAEKRGISIDLTIPESLPPVSGDADQLRQVFQNLIDNAIKYGREGTFVGVRVQEVERVPESGGRGLSVAISDMGEGIPAEHIPRLTERFYRIDKARSRSVGGTGLGLAIVKHIVSRHRGRLTIESREGEGSTFTVFLRASARPLSDAKPAESQASKASDTTS